MNRTFFVFYLFAVWGLFFGLFMIQSSMLGKAGPSVVTMTATIKGTWSFDVDTGQDVGYMADLWWEQVTETERRIVPQNGAEYANLGIVDFNSIVDFSSYNFSGDPIDGSVDHNTIPDGSVLIVKTDIGNYAKMRIDNYDYNLNVTIVVYRKPVSPPSLLNTVYLTAIFHLFYCSFILLPTLLLRSPGKPEEKSLHLLEGEQFVIDVSPTPNFKNYVALKIMLYGFPLLAMYNVMITMLLYLGMGGAPIPEVGVVPVLQTYAISYLILAIIVTGLTFIVANLMYNKHHYWVTDRRVIWKHGILGYNVTSVPLERISDVAVSRTFIEKVCGVGGLIIKEMAGEVRYYWFGSSGHFFPTMIAVPNPEDTQRRILELISAKGK